MATLTHAGSIAGRDNILNMSLLQINTISPVVPAVLNCHLLIHTLNCHLLMHTLFVHGFMNMPISDQHQGCPAKAVAPSCFTQLPLLGS